MAKAIFTTKAESQYDDLPELHYNFPQTYLNAVKQTINDLIIYYEPSRISRDRSISGGRMSYFAMARVREIIEDQLKANHYHALVDDYIEFPNAVPFKEGKFFYESILRKSDNSTNLGAFGRSVRILPDVEFNLIVQRGFGKNRLDRENEFERFGIDTVGESSDAYDRPIIQQTTARPFRDRAFSLVIKRAYESTCAITGLKLINGEGNSEIEAAHIRPVSESGPDSPRNGIALSRTVHWMFDRGIISLENDGRILLVQKLIPDQIKQLFIPDGYAFLPEKQNYHPHPLFLEFHRERVFKG